MKGFKGFNKNLQCTPNGKAFQFEIGKEYREDEAKLCESGFHFCENPLDVFRYYTPADSRFCEIEADDVSEEKESDSKRTAKGIKIGAEIGIKGIIDAFIKFRLDRVNFTGAATNSGDSGAAFSSGSFSKVKNEDVRGVAFASGYDCVASGVKGSAICLVERDDAMNIINVKAAKWFDYMSGYAYEKEVEDVTSLEAYTRVNVVWSNDESYYGIVFGDKIGYEDGKYDSLETINNHKLRGMCKVYI